MRPSTAALIAAELLASHLARVEPEYASHAAIAATNVAEVITKNLCEEFSNEQISAAVEDARELRGFIRLAERDA